MKKSLDSEKQVVSILKQRDTGSKAANPCRVIGLAVERKVAVAHTQPGWLI
jgi:hypothetical protein